MVTYKPKGETVPKCPVSFNCILRKNKTNIRRVSFNHIGTMEEFVYLEAGSLTSWLLVFLKSFLPKPHAHTPTPTHADT
ncbi:hypothetical protein RIF29_36480 [Crotalaria pallida]|uniref:Uncharacterized protein n=1 Tax=Crotalaria pallida TaxID=3830 RepID=A0AAN9HUD1_CROPI